MSAAIEIVQMERSALEDLIYRTAKKAYEDAKAEEDDELLTIAELCLRINGLSRYTFKKLLEKVKIPNVQGKYSIKAVRAALQSRSL